MFNEPPPNSGKKYILRTVPASANPPLNTEFNQVQSSESVILVGLLYPSKHPRHIARNVRGDLMHPKFIARRLRCNHGDLVTRRGA
jgi:hypothetical protein